MRLTRCHPPSACACHNLLESPSPGQACISQGPCFLVKSIWLQFLKRLWLEQVILVAIAHACTVRVCNSHSHTLPDKLLYIVRMRMCWWSQFGELIHLSVPCAGDPSGHWQPEPHLELCCPVPTGCVTNSAQGGRATTSGGEEAAGVCACVEPCVRLSLVVNVWAVCALAFCYWFGVGTMLHILAALALCKWSRKWLLSGSGTSFLNRDACTGLAMSTHGRHWFLLHLLQTSCFSWDCTFAQHPHV